MRHGAFFLAKCEALHGAEAVLFVNNRVGKIFELYFFLYERMCADKKGDFSRCHPPQELGM